MSSEIVTKVVSVPPHLDKDTHDFFFYNPELRYYPVVDKLLSDVGPQVASNIMWAIYLAEDPSSKFYTNRPEQRRKYVEDVFLKIPGFDWSLYQYVIDFYPEMTMSLATRDYYRLRRKYDSLLDEVEGLGIKDSVPFFKSLKQIYDGLESAEAKMLKERSMANGANKGKNAPGKGASQV